MNESQFFEALGRKQLVIEAQDAAYGQLLNILAGVLSGATDPSRVMVNLTARSWALAAEGMSPEMPATINGEPVCVIGKATNAP